ncbi:hypothetical protein [Rhizobium sp. NZLR11]|uniref:hypothetical protein n=1 Tax=Rhizobium sp. NZLR11 TaxID=2731098 RepID=UPI001C82BAD0|nr:hypothetical protein [Rhizobium sp. NZLR11]MBX5206735.1 hypothetical protein [Rhizobium sp. NZLR11]
MARREFTNEVYNGIVKRAFDMRLGFVCEGCGLVLGKKPWHVDHTIPDGLQIDKSAKLTVDDGKLLGVECCHTPKTAIDVKRIAKAKRVEKNYLGIKKPSCGFNKRFRRKFDGTVIDTRTGEAVSKSGECPDMENKA